MKCNNCGFKNREGVQFCEECGQRLEKVFDPICPSCGFNNREGINFCEECGSKLTASDPGTISTPRRKKSQARSEKSQIPTPPPEQPPPAPVVVQVEPERKKQRLNPLWMILLLLLLLVSCCCLLLIFEQVEVPEFAAPYVNPIIENLRNRAPDFGGNGQEGENGGQKKAPTCSEFKDILEDADLGQKTICKKSSNECYTDIHDIEFYEGLEVSYRWGLAIKKNATCEEMNGFIRCYFPRNMDEDKVSYFISIDGCSEKLGYSDGWLDDEEQKDEPEEQQEQEEQLSQDCCSITNIGSIEYLNPTVTRNLHVELICDQPWGLDPGECISGDAWIGENLDIHWTEMECCVGDDLDLLDCTSPGTVDQKKSKTLLGISDGQCEWEAEFQSPYYSECPSGQSKCAGKCCSIGHCCDCGSGTGCYESCSGCN